MALTGHFYAYIFCCLRVVVYVEVAGEKCGPGNCAIILVYAVHNKGATRDYVSVARII